MPLKTIKHTTLGDLGFYDEAFKNKEEMKDMWCWFMGAYVKEAFGAVLANAFADENSEPVKYRDKPFLRDLEQERELTQEEKEAQIATLFGNLERMEHNFRVTHGEKKNG